jgi:hypothetical protein
LKHQNFPLWATYIGERRTTFAKAYGIKVRCYRKTCWGTYWEPIGNLKGTEWENIGNQGEKKKDPCPPHPHSPKLRRKKSKAP